VDLVNELLHGTMIYCVKPLLRLLAYCHMRNNFLRFYYNSADDPSQFAQTVMNELSQENGLLVTSLADEIILFLSTLAGHHSSHSSQTLTREEFDKRHSVLITLTLSEWRDLWLIPKHSNAMNQVMDLSGPASIFLLYLLRIPSSTMNEKDVVLKHFISQGGVSWLTTSVLLPLFDNQMNLSRMGCSRMGGSP
jgi:hypothetical protein